MEAPQLVSQRMKDMLSCALGKSIAATTTAIDDANAAFIQSTGTGVMYLPSGALSAAVAAAAIDLSDAAICAEAGMSIPAGRNIYIFVIQDGTNVLARVGTMRKKVSRASATAALVTSYIYDELPQDVDNQTYVVTGYAKLVNVTNDFVIGDTLLSAAGVTDTFVDLTNMIAGSNIEG